MVKSTSQVQAFHEPPSLRPHCSSAQQWVTLELGPSSTPRQGILGYTEATGKTSQKYLEGFFLEMLSYAHYYQTLIPHMLVPPESIHLHTHSPSVLTSPLGLSNRPNQEVSEPVAGAGHSLEENTSQQTLSPRKSFSQA